ncbi:MAG TPA: MFS transporter [Bryobacteraceae bacterium]|nr:MFS transporter [Bryobacteraceae bacterium]
MKLPRMVWVVGLLLCFAAAVNYLDRQALGIVSFDIRREFSLNEQDYADILSVFFLAYTVMYAVSGYLLDRMGTRVGFAVFMFGWSVAQILHGFAQGKWSLAAFRFLLGVTEPGAWPGAAKAVNEWFPERHRALGMGTFNAGTSLGSLAAPIVIAALALRFGWRYAFIFTGVSGMVWIAAWLAFYYTPATHVEEQRHAAVTPWWNLAAARGCWVLILTRFFTDPVIFFVVFWLPEYLRKERGFDLAMVGKYSWIPFLFGGIGYLFGGWLSGRLMHAGWTLPRARKFVMALGAAVMPVAIAAPFVPTAALAIAATCFITFGHALWVANLQTLPADMFRSSEVGTVTGFTGVGGSFGSLLAQLGTGYLVVHFSYAPVFLLAGLMHPFSACLTYWLLPDRCFGPSTKTQYE